MGESYKSLVYCTLPSRDIQKVDQQSSKEHCPCIQCFSNPGMIPHKYAHKTSNKREPSIWQLPLPSLLSFQSKQAIVVH